MYKQPKREEGGSDSNAADCATQEHSTSITPIHMYIHMYTYNLKERRAAGIARQLMMADTRALSIKYPRASSS